ncbi:MAG: hypothetical protein WAN11_02270 [Syntrophobacteraceae bacterium]
MNRKTWIFVFIPVVTFFVMISATAFAATYANDLGRVETFGVVLNANLNAGSITITVNKTNKGLQDEFGEDVTFCTNRVVRVDTCSIKTYSMSDCWNQLSENAGMESRDADKSEQKAELSQIKNGDWVFISGYFDRNTRGFVADKILKLPD